MGRGLRKDDVVKSVDAFVEAARKEPLSSSIQVGFYQLKKQMKSSDALAVLVKPDNMIQTTVTVPEGSRASSIVTTIAKKTDFKKAQLERLLEQPGRLGLPASAKGNPEGYLYPATYVVTPNMSALDLLRQMVAKTVAVEKDLDLATKAQAVGMTPEEVLTTASILEFEASRDEDYPKVARAIYNRLDKGMPLQSDATVAYANDKSGTGLHLRRGAGPRLAVQHLQEHRAPSRADRLARREDDPRGAQPVVRRPAVLGRGQPADGGDPLRRQLRRPPEERRALPQVLPDLGRLLRT
jgi:UPF0755 protein